MDQNYNTEALRLAAKSVITAGLVFIACLMLGAPFWKACVGAILMAIVHRAGIGRQYAEGLAFLAIAIAIVRWIEVLPTRAEMVALPALLFR